MVRAGFDDSCAKEVVCPNDPLLFNCSVTESPAQLATVIIPSGEKVNIKSDNTTEVVGELPDGVTIRSWSALSVNGLTNYTLKLVIERASLLVGGFICDATTSNAPAVVVTCPVATGNI